MLNALIFDMDGVVINSTPYIWKSFNILLKEEGIHFSDKDIKKYLGLSLRDQFQQWTQDFGIPPMDLEEFSRKATKIQIELMQKELRPDTNLVKILHDAKKQKMKLAIATSSRRWRAEKLLQLAGVKELFDVIISSEDVSNHKPHPDIFLEAAKRVGEDPKKCVVFEDAVDGIEAAKRGGMKVVALITKYHSAQELKDADLVIPDFGAVQIKELKKL